ncbi:MAG TPA: hypothetical protein ENK83_02295 [Aliiroseovarius sp.]|nr:hypothetical protein [Aliiroseovarius sp.]
MIIKVVSLFLIGMAVLAMFGRLRIPGVDRLNRLGKSKPRKCRKCGMYVLGKGPCECEGKKG